MDRFAPFPSRSDLTADEMVAEMEQHMGVALARTDLSKLDRLQLPSRIARLGNDAAKQRGDERRWYGGFFPRDGKREMSGMRWFFVTQAERAEIPARTIYAPLKFGSVLLLSIVLAVIAWIVGGWAWRDPTPVHIGIAVVVWAAWFAVSRLARSRMPARA